MQHRINYKIPQEQISYNALQVIHGLHRAGFAAYLVGGGVRDLLLGLTPKDFDIATDALPSQIKKTFRNSRIIGRRFKLAHVYFQREIIEVATFRGTTEEYHAETGMIRYDNNFGTFEEDAWRRDFTVNALYYDPEQVTIIDLTNGFLDLEQKVIRLIGDPITRYREDPIRILRAIRLAGKLEFTLDSATAAPIEELTYLLHNVAPSRIFDEILKWFLGGKSLATFNLIQKYNLLAALFPQVAKILGQNKDFFKFVKQGFINTDQRIAEQKTVNPAFMLAVLFWPVLQKKIEHYQQQMPQTFMALHAAMNEVIKDQIKRFSVAGYLVRTIQDIWFLQYHFLQDKPKKIKRVLAHPKFKAAYDFLLLRHQSGAKIENLVDKWQKRVANGG